MKRFIVITSIFPPTESVRLFSKKKDYHLIVVGDKKTKKDWECEGVTYLSLKHQKQMGKHLEKKMPFGHYSRKMMGYLHAIQLGAGVIVDSDDDNFPKADWGFPDLEGMFSVVAPDQGFVNIYRYYTGKKIWPRGLPLHLINADISADGGNEKTQCKIGIWQSLVDGQPDVDAIYRLTNDSPCTFLERDPLVLGKNTLSPFNSQNTLTRKTLFPLLYLPAHVSFRFTDILRSLVAQPIMWLYGYRLGFCNATVIQKRNPHDYFDDFLSEIPMYRYVSEISEVVSAAVSKKMCMQDNLYQAYEELHKKKIVHSRELPVLEAWLKDLADIGEKKV